MIRDIRPFVAFLILIALTTYMYKFNLAVDCGKLDIFTLQISVLNIYQIECRI